MRFLHTADLHLGKRVNDFSMIDEQRFILDQMLGVVDEEHPDAVLLAGDIYDRTQPSDAAVELFDHFLVELAERKVQVFVISGNHDSDERIAFAGRLIDASGIHMSPVFNGTIEPHRLTDEYGAVNIYMLPFLKPLDVRRFYPEEEIPTYTDALRFIIEKMNTEPTERNVLIAHQFVTGASRSDSEEVSVGGLDNVDATVFEAFDYVALGHIHGPQQAGAPYIRYAGSPLKYSISEAGHKKSVTIIDLGAKGDVSIREVPLKPQHDLVEIRGHYNELMLKKFYDGTTLQEDFIHITLTDEEDVPDAIGKLRGIYHRLMKLDYDNTRTRSATEIVVEEEIDKKTPIELFEQLYEMQNNKPISEVQRGVLVDLIDNIWRGEES